jgi:hypothetical protein
MASDPGLAVPIQLRVALGLVPELPLAPFEAWLAAAAVPAGDRPRFGLATTADYATTTSWTSVEAADAADYLLARFEGVTADDELDLIAAVVERIEPARVGHFLEVSAGVLDRGWSLPIELPLARALALIEPNVAVERLLELADRRRLDACTRWSRSVGAGNPFTEVVLPAPLEVALEAYDALAAPRPPPAVRDALAAAGATAAALSVRITRGGLSKVGVVLPAPSTVAVLRLCAAVGRSDMDRLAAIEGALGVDGASSVEAAVFADRVAVEMAYEVVALGQG